MIFVGNYVNGWPCNLVVSSVILSICFEGYICADSIVLRDMSVLISKRMSRVWEWAQTWWTVNRSVPAYSYWGDLLLIWFPRFRGASFMFSERGIPLVGSKCGSHAYRGGSVMLFSEPGLLCWCSKKADQWYVCKQMILVGSHVNGWPCNLVGSFIILSICLDGYSCADVEKDVEGSGIGTNHGGEPSTGFLPGARRAETLFLI